MAPQKLPLIVLAGRDRKAAERGAQHNLSGFKAVDTRIDGRPMIALLLERLRAADAFDPVYIAGASAVYAPLRLDARIVDTDSSFGGNLRTAVETVVAELAPRELGLITSDVLPEREDLARVLADYRRHRPVDFWMPQHPVGESSELGASSYKPRYFIRPEGAPAPLPTLPGHLIIADPLALRRELMYRIFELAYQTRSRDIGYRRAVIVKRAFGLLLRADLAELRQRRAPGITWDMAIHGYRLATKLKQRDVGAHEMEDRLRKAWVTRTHRRRYPARRGRVAVLPCRSLARDVDTVEEAQELIEKGRL